MSQLNIKQRRSGGVVILDLDGQIRLGEANINLHNTIRELVGAGEKSLLLNLERVTNIDSSGLGELVAGYTTLEREGGDLKLLKLNSSVVQLMMITKLLTVFDVYDDEGEAVASFDKTGTAQAAEV